VRLYDIFYIGDVFDIELLPGRIEAKIPFISGNLRRKFGNIKNVVYARDRLLSRTVSAQLCC